LRLNNFIVSARPEHNGYYLQARREELKWDKGREFPPGLSTKRVHSGIFFSDTEFRGDYSSELERKYDCNVAWMEQSRNGRHGEDYFLAKGMDEQLAFWFDLVRWLESGPMIVDGHPRLYIFNTYEHSDLDFYFTFFHNREKAAGSSLVADANSIGRWHTPTYMFTVY
jgi:hypothetical protein